MRGRLVRGGMALAVVFASSLVRAQDEPPPEPSGDLRTEIAAREEELRRLSEKITEIRTARTKKEGESSRLTDVVELLEDRVRQARLELDYTTVSIEEIRLRVRQNEAELGLLQERAGRLRAQIVYLLRTLSLLDQRSPLEAFLVRGTFADFLGNQQAIARLQSRGTALLLQTHDLRRAREAREAELKTRRADLEQLAKLQAVQRASLVAQEQRQRLALNRSLSETARLGALLSEAEEARREIQQEIFTLKNAGIRLSLRQAEEFSRYAGGATGVRPALLLGVLKVESNIGTNVGSGRYPDDVHPDHREAFLRVAAKLGLDPATAPVSAKPTSYAGWGGAMGPGQIMPGMWERIEDEVGRIVGKTVPSPYELLDAFVATAVILRNAGAASGNEYEAVNRYFAGPNWQRFTWYGDRVLAVAKEYEARGL